MQIEEHRTGFDLTLTLEQVNSRADQGRGLPHSRRPPRRTRVLCSAAKENHGRARACAGEHRRGLRPCAEKNRRGAPRRRCAHTPVDAHASERARAGTNIASSAQGPPPFGVRGKETQERRKKLGGPWLDGGTPARARRPELSAAAAMPPSPASSARTIASIGEKRKGRRAREKRKEARQ